MVLFAEEVSRLAIPALGSLALDPCLQLVQTVFLGRTCGTGALAAAGLCESLFTLLLRLCNFLPYAVTPLIGAAPDASERRAIVVQALWFSFTLGVTVGALAACGAELALRWLGGNELGADVVPACVTFVRLRAIGFPADLLAAVTNGLFRGLADTRNPSVVCSAVALGRTVLGCALLMLTGNNAVDPTETALTLLACMAVASGCTTALWSISRLATALHMDMASMLIPPSNVPVMRFVRAASALCVRTMVLQACFTVASAAAAKLGTTAAAAHTVARKLSSLLALAFDALAVAGQALIAERLGKKQDHAFAWQTTLQLTRGASLLAVLSAILLIFLARPLTFLFSRDPAVVAELSWLLPVVGTMQVVASPAYILDGVLMGAGDFSFMAAAMVPSAALSVYVVRMTIGMGLGLVAPWAGFGTLMCARCV